MFVNTSLSLQMLDVKVPDLAISPCRLFPPFYDLMISSGYQMVYLLVNWSRLHGHVYIQVHHTCIILVFDYSHYSKCIVIWQSLPYAYINCTSGFKKWIPCVMMASLFAFPQQGFGSGWNDPGAFNWDALRWPLPEALTPSCSMEKPRLGYLIQ